MYVLFNSNKLYFYRKKVKLRSEAQTYRWNGIPQAARKTPKMYACANKENCRTQTFILHRRVNVLYIQNRIPSNVIYLNDKMDL